MTRANIIAELECAAGPDRNLDFMLAILAGDLSPSGVEDVRRMLAGEHVAASMRQMLAHMLPHYTASLDAALPGEDVVRVMHPADGVWVAEVRSAAGSFSGRGATEALARRAAGLRAMLAGGGRVMPLHLLTALRVAAHDDLQRVLLRDAALLAEQRGWIDAERRHHIAHLADTGALCDAALALWPGDRAGGVEWRDDSYTAWWSDAEAGVAVCTGRSRAMALAGAALRAWGAT